VSDLDVMTARPSARRYRAGDNPSVETQAQTIAGMGSAFRPRASRTAEQPQVRRTIDYADPTTRISRPTQQKPRTTHAYQQPRQGADTDTDVEVAPSVRMRSGERNALPTRELPPLREQDQGARFHWLVFVGIGMLVLMVCWIGLVRVVVWGTNTFHDPGYYTQTAHLDTVTVTMDEGHQSQIRAFLDAQGHVDMLILPVGGDTSKARVVVGPVPSSITNPQQATITVTAKGTVVTITLQGPEEANYLTTMRQSSSWIIDLKPAAGKGGH